MSSELKMREIQSINKCFLFPSLVWLLISTLLLNITLNTINVVANQDPDTKAYIVYMGERKHSDVELITESHHEMLASVLGSKEAATHSMIYSYRHGFSGFAAKLTESQAQYIAGLPGVIKVIPNSIYKLHTTRSWDYLGLSTSNTTNLLNVANQGDGIIIGVIDSGVWPESESFNDRGLGLIPTKWLGLCESGDSFDPRRHCNRKLIGARSYIAGFLAEYPGTIFDIPGNVEYRSPRDSTGHGTHCTSIAAGSIVDEISLNGLAPGTVRGGAPRARVAVYKVLWRGVATSVDVLAAFDDAIHDGVDVLSVSLGIDLPLYLEVDERDIIYYGSFHAVAKGIPVVCSGGNSGALYGSVVNVAPWVISVAASTMDRSFPTYITIGDRLNRQIFRGHSMYVGRDTGAADLYSMDRYCESIRPWDPVAGKIVLCFTVNGTIDDIRQAQTNVQRAGGLGLIATKKNFGDLSSFYSIFPCVLVSFDVATQILNYFRFTRDPRVRIQPSRTYTGIHAPTYIASFSSRGPNSLSPSVLKPDIAAPGVDIVAASLGDRLRYSFESGTSMAAPHVAGIVALLKSLHPYWSPAAIRSALVTTAWTEDPYSREPILARGDIPKIADPFDCGGGVANPNGARNPGLVFDIDTQNYINYLCAMGYSETAINQLTFRPNSCPTSDNSVLDLNLPSITVPNLNGTVTITRTVTNVGPTVSAYRHVIVSPRDTTVRVNPAALHFNANVRTITFRVTITTTHRITTEYYFGSLTWIHRDHQVRIPISVRIELPEAYVGISGDKKNELTPQSV